VARHRETHIGRWVQLSAADVEGGLGAQQIGGEVGRVACTGLSVAITGAECNSQRLVNRWHTQQPVRQRHAWVAGVFIVDVAGAGFCAQPFAL